MYVHDRIPAERRVDLEPNSNEVIWLEIQIAGGKILLGTYYRPPGGTKPDIDYFVNNLQISLDKAFSSKPKCVLMLGDFNDRWEGNHNASDLKNQSVDIVLMNGLHQLITEPTRLTATSANLLDLIITDSPGYVLDRGVSPPVCNSDHCLIYCV